MCAHCRHTRSADDPQRWDWVPQYVAEPRTRISHGICPLCLAYYYQLLPKHLRNAPAPAGR